MNDLDILRQIRNKVGQNFHAEIENETVVGLRLTSDDFIFGGLIRHHSDTEKK